MSWIWVSLEVALAAHLEQLTEHGGGEGVRDMGMLESAMARPQKLVAYGNPDAAELAASYAFGIARNHPSVSYTHLDVYKRQDLTRLDAVSYLSHGVGKGGKPSPQAEPEEKEEAQEKSGGKNKKETALDQFTVNLNEKAKGGKVCLLYTSRCV